MSTMHPDTEPFDRGAADGDEFNAAYMEALKASGYKPGHEDSTITVPADLETPVEGDDMAKHRERLADLVERRRSPSGVVPGEGEDGPPSWATSEPDDQGVDPRFTELERTDPDEAARLLQWLKNAHKPVRSEDTHESEGSDEPKPGVTEARRRLLGIKTEGSGSDREEPNQFSPEARESAKDAVDRLLAELDENHAEVIAGKNGAKVREDEILGELGLESYTAYYTSGSDLRESLVTKRLAAKAEEPTDSDDIKSSESSEPPQDAGEDPTTPPASADSGSNGSDGGNQPPAPETPDEPDNNPQDPRAAQPVLTALHNDDSNPKQNPEPATDGADVWTDGLFGKGDDADGDGADFNTGDWWDGGLSILLGGDASAWDDSSHEAPSTTNTPKEVNDNLAFDGIPLEYGKEVKLEIPSLGSVKASVADLVASTEDGTHRYVLEIEDEHGTKKQLEVSYEELRELVAQLSAAPGSELDSGSNEERRRRLRDRIPTKAQLKGSWDRLGSYLTSPEMDAHLDKLDDGLDRLVGFIGKRTGRARVWAGEVFKVREYFGAYLDIRDNPSVAQDEKATAWNKYQTARKRLQNGLIAGQTIVSYATWIGAAKLMHREYPLLDDLEKGATVASFGAAINMAVELGRATSMKRQELKARGMTKITTAGFDAAEKLRALKGKVADKLVARNLAEEDAEGRRHLNERGKRIVKIGTIATGVAVVAGVAVKMYSDRYGGFKNPFDLIEFDNLNPFDEKPRKPATGGSGVSGTETTLPTTPAPTTGGSGHTLAEQQYLEGVAAINKVKPNATQADINRVIDLAQQRQSSGNGPLFDANFQRFLEESERLAREAAENSGS